MFFGRLLVALIQVGDNDDPCTLGELFARAEASNTELEFSIRAQNLGLDESIVTLTYGTAPGFDEYSAVITSLTESLLSFGVDPSASGFNLRYVIFQFF